MPEQHDECHRSHRRADDREQLARAQLVRGCLFFLLVVRLLHLLCLGDGVHGGDILRGLVHGLAVQVFDREVEVDLGILAELLKVCEHFIRRGVALLQIGGHRLHADELKRFGHVGIDLARRERHGGKVLDGDGNGVVALERESPRQHFVEHDARGVDVRARVRAVAPRLLGRHVVHRAERLLRERVGGVGEAGDAEVSDLDAAVAKHHDVLRLDVAVDDAARMRVRERLHDLRDEVQRLTPVELAALFHILLERDAVDELHDDILRLAAADVVD